MHNIGQLLIGLQKAHRATIADKISRLGLHPGQDGLLYHLSQNDGLTMTELVEKLKIKHPTLFKMVERMEASGLIKKSKDETDKRASRIFLSSKGKDQVAELSKIWQELEKQLLNGLSNEEIEVVKSILTKVIHNLKK